MAHRGHHSGRGARVVYPGLVAWGVGCSHGAVIDTKLLAWKAALGRSAWGWLVIPSVAGESRHAPSQLPHRGRTSGVTRAANGLKDGNRSLAWARTGIRGALMPESRGRRKRQPTKTARTTARPTARSTTTTNPRPSSPPAPRRRGLWAAMKGLMRRQKSG